MSKSVIFGSHKNRGDINIDKAIIHELSKTHSISSGDLKSLVEKSLGRIISSITFSVHIKNMLQEGELEKNDTGRGQKVFYSGKVEKAIKVESSSTPATTHVI